MHTGQRFWLCVGDAVRGALDKCVQQSASAKKIVLGFHVICLETRNKFNLMVRDTNDI